MLTYAKHMPIAPLAKMAREHDTRIWRVIEHHVNTARAGLDFADVTDVGMDETSAKRGQDYVSIFMDLAERRVMFATQGRDALTVKAFAADLLAHGGEQTTQIERVCCDMSQAFIKGIKTHLSSEPQDAQEGEDAVLTCMFDKKINGFYVDIGCHHPHRFSNSYAFYRRGWR